MPIVLEKDGIQAEFSEQTGAMLRLANANTGWEIYGSAENELFEMNIMLPGREKNIARSSAQALSQYTLTEDVLTLVWETIDTEFSRGLEIRFTAEITVTKGGFRFGGKLENRSNYSVEHIAYPCISDLQRPAGAERFLRKNWKYAEMAEVELYPHFRNEYGYWSNEFAFQRVGNPESAFVLMEDGSQGLYAGCHDTNIPYSLQFFYELKPGLSDTYFQQPETPQDDGSIRPWISFSPVHLLFLAAGKEKQLMPVILAPYRGDWQDGIDIYKAWRATWHQPAPMPAWVAEPHAWYQVQMNSYGDGLRRKYSDLPAIAETCKAYGISVIQVTGWTLQGQDGCLPCHDIDPRLGTWQELYDAIATCEQMGVHIILYTKFNFADTRTDWFRNELYQYASRDRFGEIHSFSGYNYERPAILSGVNSHRLAVMCQNSREWQRVCRAEFQKCLDLNASGILYDEPQHHSMMIMCFDPSHGHEVPAHTFAGDLTLGAQFQEMCRRAGKEGFLLAGECCYDLESNYYPLSYFRVGEECGMRTTSFATPVQRYVDSDYPYLCGVWGFNDRNSLNICLLYRYIISYETRHFRGDVDAFPQMLHYGMKIDALRKRYVDVMWNTEFLGTHGASVACGGEIAYAVHRSKKTGKRAVMAANLSDHGANCTISLPGAEGLSLVTPDIPEKTVFSGTLCIPARSAAVVIEE